MDIIENLFEFIMAAEEVLEDADLEEEKEFICPCCGGRAVAVNLMHGSDTVEYARCSQCEMEILS